MRRQFAWNDFCIRCCRAPCRIAEFGQQGRKLRRDGIVGKDQKTVSRRRSLVRRDKLERRGIDRRIMQVCRKRFRSRKLRVFDKISFQLSDRRRLTRHGELLLRQRARRL